MIERLLKSPKSNSFFLFGNRGVGKSTWLKSQFPIDQHLWFDLLDRDWERRLLLKPALLGEILSDEMKKYPKGTTVVIDEIQKIPDLLNVVHQHIEKKHFRFVLTGSSARKLRKQGINLLAGRAFLTYMYPFTHLELGDQFELEKTLQWGALPKLTELISDEEKSDFLSSYTDAYLREEIIAEQLVRRIQPFRQFLDVAAQMNTKIINYNKISQDIGIEIPTVQNYFSIMEDTFVGFLLNPFHESVRKRQRSNPKFYFFDIGVVRSLQNRLKINIATGTYDYGILFEQFFILEVLRLNAYFKKSFRFYYLKTHGNVEVDLIIERPGQHYLFIEIKSTNEIRSLHSESLTGFSKLVKDFKKSIGYVVSQDPIAREEDEIRFRPWDIFLQETFNKQ